jgi:putative oxidoreductase
MGRTVRIIQGLLVIGFLFFGFMKLSANPMQVEAFNNVYGYGTGFMYVVGAIEIISAIGLLIGYWKKNLVPIFSGVLIVVMAGAVFTHLQAGQGFGVAMTPLILLILAVVVFWGQKKLNQKQISEV